MDVFIVRPFGEKNGIDFEQVERELIQPALSEAGLVGATTEQIARSGNIRSDMMESLLTAKIVIADISIHNANVFYELGVRHALRDRVTVLVRGTEPPREEQDEKRRGDAVPFDLRTDRYLRYDLNEPGECVSALARALIESVAAQNVDSPVFSAIPELARHDVSSFHSVPQEFGEAVAHALHGRDVGLLGLLVAEALGQSWCVPGLRSVARALRDCSAFRLEAHAWSGLLQEEANDVEALLGLGTAYERIDRIVDSNLALDGVLALSSLSPTHRAEAQALRARNVKRQWGETWWDRPEDERQVAALESPLLEDAANGYRRAYDHDLNHYFSGLNALALTAVLCELIDGHPDTWSARFSDSFEAEVSLRRLQKARERLGHLVGAALDAAKREAERAEKHDSWLDISVADRLLLVGAPEQRVRIAYASALQRPTPGFNVEAAARQLRLYRRLGLFPQTAAALTGLGLDPDAQPAAALIERRITIVATGHRVDVPGRSEPRFPNDERHARLVREAIESRVLDVLGDRRAGVSGIAGLANGSDILFHEVCRGLGVPTEALLPIPTEAYVRASVEDGGPDWVRRFRDIASVVPVRELSDSDQMPPWVGPRTDYSVYQRGNLWALESAFGKSDSDVVLLAVWNRAKGDGPGGTADMVRLAESRNARIEIIEVPAVFGDIESDAEPNR